MSEPGTEPERARCLELFQLALQPVGPLAFLPPPMIQDPEQLPGHLGMDGRLPG
jgi:hypothetical protein